MRGGARPRCCQTTQQQGMHKGAQPSCGGSRSQGACQRSVLARDVLRGVGGTRPPRFAPGGGNGKGGDQTSLLPQAESCVVYDSFSVVVMDLVRQLRGPHLSTCPW
jgi:hypothetical protein